MLPISARYIVHEAGEIVGKVDHIMGKKWQGTRWGSPPSPLFDSPVPAHVWVLTTSLEAPAAGGFVKRRGWYARCSKNGMHCLACRVFHPARYARRTLRSLVWP